MRYEYYHECVQFMNTSVICSKCCSTTTGESSIGAYMYLTTQQNFQVTLDTRPSLIFLLEVKKTERRMGMRLQADILLFDTTFFLLQFLPIGLRVGGTHCMH